MVEPELGPFDIHIQDFMELDTCRPQMANCPIPFTAIHKFATIKGIEDFDEFLYYIRKLDHILVNHREKNGNSNQNNPSSK